MHRLTSLSTLAAAAALLGACASMSNGPDAATRQASSECKRLYADPRLDPIRNNIQLPISYEAPQPIELLANKARATEAEKPAIKALSETIIECRQVSEATLGTLPRYRVRSEDRTLEALADLYEGTSTYGQFARDLLYIGEHDKIARETLDEELRSREKFRGLHEYDN